MHHRQGVSSVALLSVLVTTGCFGHPLDPGEIAAEDLALGAGAPARGRGGETVRCRCDAEGGLHVRTPAGATLRVPDGARGEDAEAEITLADDAPAQPIRRTRSLGFIGDNKLTEGRSRGGPWNAPDAVMPIHPHGSSSYGYGSGYAVRSGYGPASGGRGTFGHGRPR
jgi:hypothetical protein